MVLTSRSGTLVLVGIAMASFLTGCATVSEDSGPESAERHYERACDSASRAIDNLMVHWENPRSSERMPTSQILRAREAMGIIAPACKNISGILALDSTSRARVDAAFGVLESAARNMPRLPAGN